MATSVASLGKLKQQKLQNTIQNTHTKIKTVFIKTNSQNTHKKANKQKCRLEGMNYILTWSATKTKKHKNWEKDLNMTIAIDLVYTKHPKQTKKTQKKMIKDLNRTIRQKTK